MSSCGKIINDNQSRLYRNAHSPQQFWFCLIRCSGNLVNQGLKNALEGLSIIFTPHSNLDSPFSPFDCLRPLHLSMASGDPIFGFSPRNWPPIWRYRQSSSSQPSSTPPARTLNQLPQTTSVQTLPEARRQREAPPVPIVSRLAVTYDRPSGFYQFMFIDFPSPSPGEL